MKNLIITCALVILSSSAFSQSKLPIIDMHLHSNGAIWSKVRMCFPEPCEKIPTEAKEVEQLLSMTLDQFDKHNIVLGVLSGFDYELNKNWLKADKRFIFGPVIDHPDKINYDLIKRDIDNGTIKVIGEITSQYLGYSMNTPELDSIFQIAEENDLPVLVHSAGLGGTAHFPIQKGNPMSLNDVIRKHPKLRVYIENAAWPFGDEVISLMYTNPNVYADLSTISWIIPKPTFHAYLKRLIDAGLSDRLMFGSDQMIWPESIELAIEAINSADFLSDEQKRNIFYNNAARFLRLSDEEIKKHHNQTKAANKR
jgi:hypothetical protein